MDIWTAHLALDISCPPTQSSIHYRTSWHALFQEQWDAKGQSWPHLGFKRLQLHTVTAWLRSGFRFLAGAGAGRRGQQSLYLRTSPKPLKEVCRAACWEVSSAPFRLDSCFSPHFRLPGVSQVLPAEPV